jgi:Trypsin-co-occurring domain 2
LSPTITISREAAPGGAKVRFWVVEAGTEARVSRETLQELKLVLTPRDMMVEVASDGSHLLPLIPGDELPGEGRNCAPGMRPEAH